EFKAPWNELLNVPRVYTAEDRAIVSPNSDTPYSMVGMDLRAEPIVLTVPPIEDERYFSIQLIDAYTHNFDYIGSRATGNGGGSYLVVGPGWDGNKPAAVQKLFRSETQFALAVYRTQLFNPDDLDNVKAVQAGYRAQTLSAFLGEPAPAAAPTAGFVEPLTPETQKTSLRFFTILSYILGFCPTHPSEVDLRDRFAQAGFDGGMLFDPDSLTPEAQAAMRQGMADAWVEFASFKEEQMDTKKVTVGDIFGTREYLDNNYLYRMAAGVLGLYGNSKHEAMYPFYGVDSDGQPLTGAFRYALRFPPGQLPPVHAFWSLTMYKLPESLLVANSLNRYLINSPMLPHLKHDPDGGLTLHLQHETPGADEEANWLPAPAGPFMTALRLYWPKEEATSGTWKEPPLQRL
ncbi:MAG TPA: DUF1254 domain-containing protein, partial [Dermatophilaceae bacterium]